jgi:LmbE family N-acetylglucosaminyl deacetylase
MSIEKLIIAPHVDDDILGCGGIMDDKSLVVYCGIDDFHVISREERIGEADSAAKVLGHSYKLLHGNKVNNYQAIDLIEDLSLCINQAQPKQVYIPYPSYNQDHRAVYEASLISLRPHDVNYFVKEVLVYEQPHSFIWNHTHDINSSQFNPNCFFSIDIERKLEAYRAMPSQVRSFRSQEHIKSLATIRGAQANCFYAEAFQIIRSVR